MLLLLLFVSLAAAQAALLSGRGQSFCSIQPDRQVYCFGLNEYGNLGLGSFENPSVPTRMLDVANATDVSSGAKHVCIVDSLRVRCAGDNTVGQLGDGTMQLSPVLTRVANHTSPVSKVAVSSQFHSCALYVSGGVTCWGWGDFGQLGNSDLSQSSPTAHSVFGFELDGAADLAVGYVHTCVVTRRTGQVQCTGRNNYGQLGVGPASLLQWTMTAVPGLDGVSVVSAGDFHTCAIRALSGSLHCWGDNYFGALGVGPELGISYLTLPVLGVLDAVKVFCGDLATYVVLRNGTASRFGYTWNIGANASYNYVPVPFAMLGVEEIQGGAAACVQKAMGAVECIGADAYGQLGNGFPLQRESSVWAPTAPITLATKRPVGRPTRPTKKPTFRPTKRPSKFPTLRPTSQAPTKRPTTQAPTKRPTLEPTSRPSKSPTLEPTKRPTMAPTSRPSKSPTFEPTKRPTKAPTDRPSKRPTLEPTTRPSKSPTLAPTSTPSNAPTFEPTRLPTLAPTTRPSKSPTLEPTKRPTTTRPSKSPTLEPTFRPTKAPTDKPTKRPTKAPTDKPTKRPTLEPTTRPSKSPTSKPTRPTKRPTMAPTTQPTLEPTSLPTLSPTHQPSTSPTLQPTRQPTKLPTKYPTRPTRRPTKYPSRK